MYFTACASTPPTGMYSKMRKYTKLTGMRNVNLATTKNSETGSQRMLDGGGETGRKGAMAVPARLLALR